MIPNILNNFIARVKAAPIDLTVHVPTGDKINSNWDSIKSTINGVTDMLLYLAGGFAIFGVILGSFKYITAYGDDTKIASAKKEILWSIIGLVVIIFAKFIILFIQEVFMNPPKYS